MTAMRTQPSGRTALILDLAQIPLALFDGPFATCRGAAVYPVQIMRTTDLTVRFGDPFVADNAARLQTTAWALLGLELLHLAVGAIAASVSTAAQPLDIGWNFSITRWLAVLLLFVFARVFEHGTRMRDDLEGTV